MNKEKLIIKLKKIKAKIDKKNLSPAGNRKKVGVILFAASIAVFLIFAIRFSYLITVGKVASESLSEKKQALYQGSSVVKAKRGTIYDRNGQVIAKDATSYSLYAELDEEFIGLNGKELFVHEKDHGRIAEILNKYAGVEKELTLKQLSQTTNEAGDKIKSVEFGAAGKNLSLETKLNIEAALEKAKITGIYFMEHPARMYPNGVFSSHLIGYVAPSDKKNEDSALTGVMGIEAAYDDLLRGKDGLKYYQRDVNGNEIPGTAVIDKEAEDGQDIYTTIDSNLQFRLEELMDEVAKEAEPVEATATVVDPATGEVLAASQRPTFNPETKEGLTKEKKDDPEPTWQNLLVQSSFEPGSTMKVFTVAAAVESGNFNEHATFQSGSIDVGDATINDWDFGSGMLTFRQALAHSSNVGMVHLEQKMGEQWPKFLNKFGFGQTTNSGLGGEITGSIQDSTIVDTAMTSFGQAISVTPVQMLQGFTAIANGGEMMRPQFIKKTTTQGGKDNVLKPTVVGTPIEATTANAVLTYMGDVVNDANYGTGYGVYDIEGVNVSAKTGTAQIFDEKQGKYLSGARDYVYSVVQIAPTEDPKYIVYVTLKQPSDKVGPDQMIAKISNGILKHALQIEAGNTPSDN